MAWEPQAKLTGPDRKRTHLAPLCVKTRPGVSF